MPQYELMYLLGSHVADTEVPTITEQVKKTITDFGGENIVEQQLGKKKLAYPIKKTRNGYYVVVHFSMDSQQINKLDAKIRTQNATIIRYLLINLDDHLERIEKDKKIQAKIIRKPISDTTAEGDLPIQKKEKTAAILEPLLDINQEELDKKIEEALSEDLTK